MKGAYLLCLEADLKSVRYTMDLKKLVGEV